MKRIFIGYDQRQPLAFTVAAHSIITTASEPVSVSPLILATLPIEKRGLTEFTYSRYLVPWLCGFEGHALFADPDILCMGDVAELPWDHEDSVRVVPHESAVKGGDVVSTVFERPAVMLFNCGKCTALTPEYVEENQTQSFAWAESVGDLPFEWNHLIGYDKPIKAKLAHYTMGIPCWPETEKCQYSGEWQSALSHALSTVDYDVLMGTSVHARYVRQDQDAFAGAAHQFSARRG